MEIAVFGGGCFWCTEAVFQRLNGVKSVVSGYAGGNKENPSYQEVSYEETGHAEVVKVEFDPTKISYKQLLEVFWYVHDPTTLNQQGNDVGTQYRSIILYTSDEQKREAEQSIKEMQEKYNNQPIAKRVVTEIKPLVKFYTAEEYHQQYFEKNPNQPYCQLIIGPKLEHFEMMFSNLLKK